MGALDGIRVLDLGLLVQGPQAAAMLGDLGADVIKVELPGFGDQSRWIAASQTDPRPPYFHGCNRGKKSVTIDLRTPSGKVIFKKLAATADVIISNFKPGTLDEWGLGYEDLSADHPGLVYATGSVLGPNGPHATGEGADLAGQAYGGLISTTGVTGGQPTPVGVTIADHIASQNMTVGILAALMSRHTTGRGQRVDVSLVGGQVWAQASELTAFFMTGEQARPADRSHPLLHFIYGIFKTSDGWLALIGVPAPLKQQFCDALGHPELIDDPRVQALLMHPDDKQALFKVLDEIIITDTTDNWVARLRAAGQRVAPVNDYARLAADPHMTLNGYLIDVDHPTFGPMKQVGNPIQMSATPPVPGLVAPELGQDTELVLLELGYTWDEMEQFRSSGVI